MITLVPREDVTDFERKYVYCEAPGDDERPKRNLRRITLRDGGVSVNGRDPQGVDDVDLDTDDDTEDVDIDDLEDDEIDLETDDLDDDALADDGGNDDVELENPGELGGEEDTTPPDNETGADDAAGSGDIATEPTDDAGGGGDDNDPGDDAGDGGGDIEVEPEGDDAGEDEGEEETGGNDAGGDAETPVSPEDKDEIIRKKALFRRFNTLHDAIGKYIEKLNMMMAYSSDYSKGYREICDDFDTLKTYIYDYMLIKFPEASYPKSRLFYEWAMTAAGVILEKLGDTSIVEDKDSKNGKKHISKTGKKKSGKPN